MGPSPSVCLARQSIYNLDLAPCGYELLYRSTPSADSAADGAVDTAMSTFTLRAALLDFGLDALVGHRPVWVNVGDALLIDDLVAALPPERTVVEVLEGAWSTEPALTVLRGSAPTATASRSTTSSSVPELAPLLELADVVKLDVLALGRERLEEQVRRARPLPMSSSLAEKVETHDVLDVPRARLHALPGLLPLEAAALSGAAAASTETALPRVQLSRSSNDRDADFDRLAE